MKLSRRWLTISLRSYFVALTFALIVFGIATDHRRRRYSAVSAIERHGGTVIYDYGDLADRRRRGMSASVQGPIAYRTWQDVVFGHSYLSVSLWNTSDVPKPVMRSLQSLYEIEWLCLSHSRFEEKELIDLLSRLPNLQRLELRNCSITDSALPHIERCTELEFLDLDGTSITDEGLLHLVKLKQLQELRVSGTLVTRDGLSRFRQSNSSCRLSSNWSDTTWSEFP
jgi:hypothetical protein